MPHSLTSSNSNPVALAPVSVHLGADRLTARQVRAWCDDHRGDLADRGVVARTSWRELRDAVPGLEWDSGAGRAALREHLTGPGPVLFSSAAPLGPAYLHTGGALHPLAPAGIDALTAALRATPWQLHLTLASHARTAVAAWVAAVRHGHLVRTTDFWQSLDDPSWVPLVEHAVGAIGADRVVVHDGTGAVPPTAQVLRACLAELVDHVDDLDLSVPTTQDGHWSARQLEVALTALPYLRSKAERDALRAMIDRSIDPDGTPAWPLDPAAEAEAAARDAADLARLTDLVEVR